MCRIRGNSVYFIATLFFVACSTTVETPRDLDASLPDSAINSSSSDAGKPQDANMGCVDDDGDGVCADDDCDDANAYIYPGAPEACNNIDDNCDGVKDDALGENSCGQGACSNRVPNCVAGEVNICEPTLPSVETCNSIDDDCDGDVDEEIPPSETCGVGACRSESQCIAGAWSSCVPGSPSEETCNRIDDDCDGELDEGFRARYVNGTYSALSNFEVGCDGVSQRIGLDCNKAMHLFCAAESCRSSGFGPLENSGDISHVGCVQSTIIELQYSDLTAKHPGCDGNNQVIGPECNAAIHRYCADNGFRSGHGPVEREASTVKISCISSDVGTIVHTTYSTLTQKHGPCNGATERIGPNCNAAISRFCKDRGHTTGFGPLENSGDNLVVLCIDP